MQTVFTQRGREKKGGGWVGERERERGGKRVVGG
jgi:hypothetical protein